VKMFNFGTIWEPLLISFKISDRTSLETHYVSATEPNWLMLFGETVAVYYENHAEHTHTHSVGRMQSFSASMSNQMVHVITTVYHMVDAIPH
jgi:hypothetical protein